MTYFQKQLASLKTLNSEKSLKKPITLKFLIAGLVPMVLISVIALWLLSSAATNLVHQNLSAIKENKAFIIESYGDTIVNQVLTASADPNTVSGLIILSRSFNEVFDDAFDQTDMEQYDYDEELYADALRADLAQYYNNEFAVQYRDSTSGKNINTENLLNNLTNTALALQHAYIFDNPAPLGSKHEMYKSKLDLSYDLNHDRIHLTFEPYLDKFGYYDIFLVDNKGNVVYSVYKELDYATNLLSGPYRESGLAEAFRASKDLTGPNQYVLIDYAQYTPSYEAPASFIASPVYKYGNQVGSLIFQMPLDTISSIMSQRKGLGETAEVYLVGPDMLPRSDSYKMPEKYNVDVAFRAGNTVESEAIEAALDDQSGVIEQTNYLGQDVLAGYIPVAFGNLQWAMIAEIEQSEAYASITRLIWIILSVCLIAVIAISYFAIRVADKLIQPIASMQTSMTNIAENSVFGERVNIDREDEIGQSANSFNQLLSSIETSINETNQVVSAMAQGDFSKRVESDFKGDLLTLKRGVNNSASAMGGSIKDVNRVVNALAMGNFNQTIDSELSGELGTLKDNVNTSITSMKSAMQEINELIRAMSKGDFKYKVEGELQGDYASLVEQANLAMQAVDSAVTEIDTVMSDVAAGQLKSRIEKPLPGQLEQIKENVNTSLSVVEKVFQETETALSAISEGILYERINTDFPGQFNHLKTSTNNTLNKLIEVVSEISNSSSAVNANAMELLQGNNQLSDRTVEQSSNLDRTASSMDEITVTVRHTEENARHANKIANQAKESAVKGGQIVTQAIDAMQDINVASNKISDIIGVIDSIAFQTNLLALNAAVEAARAGEQGRGFAVVASEVRNLAGRSANAAKEIKSLINDTVDKVDVGSELVSQSGSTLDQIIQQVENVDQIVSEISNAASEQSQGVKEIHQAVESIKTLTQQNTGMVEEGTAASENLKNKAQGMNQLMEFFKTA
ncbi:methyl-accepting chemotaxis protein [Glaciecola petra]|uniref:Methyl-accepting chemotaxis protein n=1 Tax=Glaciecola petra TaxID=3075602 RepID=A0ABU2ZQR3_9ALTE|nr:methyl-accepting chemotaxis protein [Aestuariibacter sp. P117]MDT0594975.1 methyl-accepting chemotaxis protein [Aestuariibacter sp. P117]